jgi:hypothetical protein
VKNNILKELYNIMNKVEQDEWAVKFINLPSKDQIDFLFRYSMEETLMKEVEEKINTLMQ